MPLLQLPFDLHVLIFDAVASGSGDASLQTLQSLARTNTALYETFKRYEGKFLGPALRSVTASSRTLRVALELERQQKEKPSGDITGEGEILPDEPLPELGPEPQPHLPIPTDINSLKNIHRSHLELVRLARIMRALHTLPQFSHGLSTNRQYHHKSEWLQGLYYYALNGMQPDSQYLRDENDVRSVIHGQVYWTLEQAWCSPYASFSDFYGKGYFFSGIIWVMIAVPGKWKILGELLGAWEDEAVLWTETLWKEARVDRFEKWWRERERGMVETFLDFLTDLEIPRCGLSNYLDSLQEVLRDPNSRGRIYSY